MTRSKTLYAVLSSTSLGLLAAAPAHAHHAMGGRTPGNFFEGFVSGLAHPVIGVDHFAFLIVVALLSFAVKSGARYLLPAAFVGTTLVGTMAHVAAADIPFTEVIIALSVLLGGALVLLRRDLGALALGAMFALFGIFHGYAYGESIVGAESSALFAYLLGFSLIQYGVMLAVMKGMDWLASRSESRHLLTSRVGGALAASTGGLMLALNLG